MINRINRFAGIGGTNYHKASSGGIREQDRMDALTVLNAMSTTEYKPLASIAAAAKLTPARTQRVLTTWPTLFEHGFCQKPYQTNGRTKFSSVYRYRRTPDAILKVRNA